MTSQQYPTARESPREFSRASGAMINAQNINRALALILSNLSNEPVLTIDCADVKELQDMLDETVEQQTQSQALLEKIKAELRNH